MIRHSLTQLSLRLLIAWLLVSVLLFIAGEWIIRCLLPYLSFLTHLIARDYHADLAIAESSAGKIIAIVATATDDVYRADIPIAPKGTRINASGTLMHALVPIAILFTIICAWPATFKKYVTQIFLALPISLCILALTTPVLLAGHIEQVFHTAAQNYAGKELPMSFMMGWVVFMEVGGVWLLPILGAFVCIKLNGLIDYLLGNKSFMRANRASTK